jgi:cytochrome c oxidase cbb3-type subunit 3
MSKRPQQKQQAEPETTGHEWDGIKEYNNPLPRWWLWTFYGTIVWAVLYTIAYPAWPMIARATPGLLGYSTRAEVAADIQAFRDANADLETRLVAADLTAIPADPELNNFAVRGGAAVFRTNCSQCHGSGAAGALGYPNLLDDDWLWGGDLESIHATVAHGIRNTTDDEARYSEMPRFGADELLSDEEIDQVVQHVLAISNQPHDASLAEAGAAIFADNCIACHGEEGLGDTALGAPNLTDAIWLYGGDVASVTESVANARFGVMPNWNTRLSEAQIRQVTVYVHQLGGGE